MLNVYFTGLIYLNGCNVPDKRAYAPDGRDYDPPHQASLWIAASLIDEDATDWWDGWRFSHQYEVTGGGAGKRTVNVVEFRLPDQADISFPDDGHAGTCTDLDDLMPKLKKKKNDGTEEPYVIDPATAETIAEVAIVGGAIQPKRFDQLGFVEWDINSAAPLAITAALKGADGEAGSSSSSESEEEIDSRTITLIDPGNGDPIEVVLSNMHTVPDNAKRDILAHGDHIPLFVKLNAKEAGAQLVSRKAPGMVGQLRTGNAFISFLKSVGFSDGETPNCCHQ